METGYKESVLCDFRVQNMVANYSLGSSIDLRLLYNQYQTESNFAPELFPGLVMRFANTKVVYLVFESGKAIITGAQSVEEVSDKAMHLESVLKEVYGLD